MMDPQRVASLIQAALVADSYCLGLHWIYDHDLLDSVPLNPKTLNPPLSHWHGTKTAGDLTHYGDQLWHLYQYLQQHGDLDVERYIVQWASFMKHYHGHIDKATAATLDNIRHGITPPGSNSTEFSVTSRVACPLLYADSPESYLGEVEAMTRMTHDSTIAVDSCLFFASILLDCLNGSTIANAVQARLELLPPAMKRAARKGIASASECTHIALRQFGIACDTRYALPGVMHLLHRYQNPVRLLQENALAGGDSSARGMICLMLLVAEQPEKLQQLPNEWLQAIAIFNT